MKKFFIIFMSFVFIFIVWDVYTHYDYIDAFSGATPKALAGKVPSGISIEVKAFGGKSYQFNTSSFKLLAKTRVRTREVGKEGQIIGSYSYEGVPLRVLLEGVDPDKSLDAPFDRPTDIVVKVKTSDGEVSYFSYGELTMGTDENPVILAYQRSDVLPDKEPEKYTGNLRKGDIRGLCLVCPGDVDVSRYLMDVKELEFYSPDLKNSGIPIMNKGMQYTSSQVEFVDKDSRTKVKAEDLMRNEKIFKWFRIGHGRGIKRRDPVEVKGTDFGELLKAVFSDIEGEDFFMIVGGDGYRAVFSGFELLKNRTSERVILVSSFDGKPPVSGVLLGVISDFYIDRSVRGVSHIVRFTL